jgi:membrane-bound ClpP family serine protease
MNTLLWVLVLILIGLGVMVLEVFVPSGGILGFVSVLALVAGIATAFLEQGAVAGMAALGVVVLAVPAVLAVAFRWFPETPLGRRVLPPPPDAAELLPDPARRKRARELVGRQGRTVSELLPWGGVEIDGVVVESMSESGPIDAGTLVDVIGAQGTAVVVRRAEPAAAPPPAQQEPPEKPAPGGTTALSPTLESFDFDGLEPPAA